MDLPVDFDKNKKEYLKVKHGKPIGNGTFGFVLEGFWNGKKVAIKNLFNMSEKEGFISEIENLCRVKHKNIIKCLGYSRENVIIVMEFSENGSLHELLYYRQEIEYNLAHALNWALQCAEGINYLHTFGSKPILHRDLKTLNLLLMNKFKILKICDFGTSCGIKTNMTNGQGTASWMAPEVIRSNKYDEKCDVYSWAIILWQVLSRQIIYSGEISYITIMWLVNSGSRPPFLFNCPKVIEEILIKCWSDNPVNRPSMKIICEKMCKIFSIVKKWTDVELKNGISNSSHEHFINEETICTTNEINDRKINFQDSLYCNSNEVYCLSTQPLNLTAISDNLNNKNNNDNLINCNINSKKDYLMDSKTCQIENNNRNNYSELQIQISQPVIEIAKIHNLKINDTVKNKHVDQSISNFSENIKSIPISIISRGKNPIFSHAISIDEIDVEGCMNFVSTFSKVLNANKRNNPDSESKFYINYFDSVNNFSENKDLE